MMKKIVLIISITFIVCGLTAGAAIRAYLLKVDTIFAHNFSKVMNSYDITEIDSYFSNDTMFICNDKSGTYAELKNNIEKACKDGVLVIFDSYGSGDNKFVNNLQEVSIMVYGQYNNKYVGEGFLTMTLKKTGLFKITIESVECDDAFFEAIFFG